MTLTRIKTRVIMDSGKEYIFEEPLDHFLKRLYDETIKKELHGELGLIHSRGFSISIFHISSLEEFE